MEGTEGTITPATSDLAYIFIDYSNIILGSPFASEYFSLDLNRLVITVCNGRKLGEVFIAGSTPNQSPTPSKDEYSWKQAEDHGFNVETFQRNASGKEKGVDVHLACNMMEIILTKTPGIILLVTGDSDFSTPIKKARKYNWEVEVWSWVKAMANDLRSFPFGSLDAYYESFAYITEPDSTKNRLTIEISGDIIENWKWRNEPIMKCFRALNLLCQFHWVDDTTAHLYFDRESDLKHAKGWLSKSHPDLLVNDEPSFTVVDLTASIMMY